ncbi:hypothetical protein RQCS_40500 [Rhodococcus qingshengii]|uniref:hypothetical protein n=1 Tax=Rhodococcus qingshengii TaxID=334542 RepID=UPI000A4805C4|nr:hypothetical protein [Rhodococcus qingshengii]BCF84505.1 hypothetical protein RQCS_40500 [Rhodococcus qingshengii]
MSKSKDFKTSGSGVDVTYVPSSQFTRMASQDTPLSPRMERMLANRAAGLRAR